MGYNINKEMINMNLERFIGNLAMKGLMAEDMGDKFINMIGDMGYDVENLDYKEVYVFFNRLVRTSVVDYDLLKWLEENIEVGLLVEDVYEEYLNWVINNDKLMLDKIEFGKVVNQNTNFKTSIRYISYLGESKRVYELKD